MRREARASWVCRLGLSFCLCFVAGCGNVGPPVPPEFVGVGAKLQRDKEKDRAKEEERRKGLEQEKGKAAEPVVPSGETGPEVEQTPTEETQEDDVILPSLRPIGVPPGSQPEQ